MELRKISDIPEGYQTLEYHNLRIVDANGYATIFLNGHEMGIVDEANSKEGWVKGLIFNSDGNPILVENKDTKELECATCTLYGDVVIVDLVYDGSIKMNS